jgi:CubicO group peptidase (beta-lactamase class C family)
MEVPALPEVLAGQGNTPAVQVFTEPGAGFSYSGGGYELVEQTMLDVSDAPDFDRLMRELVFDPAGMVNSRYALDLPADVAVRATPGSTEGLELPQRWQAHPESAAAGLWTTADDLGRFLAALTTSMSGADETLLPTVWAQRMVTGVEDVGRGVQVGHGLFVSHQGQEFGHDGVNVGYNASIAGTVDGRFAIAVVTNADPGGLTLAAEIIDTIAIKMGWR